VRKLLAISGKRFSGKDTFAGALRRHALGAGVSLELHAFAAESKRLFVDARRAAGGDVDLGRLTTDRAYKESLRPALTRFTVDAIARDPLVFCRAVADRIAASGSPSLVTDLRLRLEIDHLRSRFDLRVVRLARPDARRAESGWRYDPAADGHPTETELDDPSLWHELVVNDGTLAALDEKAARVAGAYFAWLA
jgi:phosphomevalonate kinase